MKRRTLLRDSFLLLRLRHSVRTLRHSSYKLCAVRGRLSALPARPYPVHPTLTSNLSKDCPGHQLRLDSGDGNGAERFRCNFRHTDTPASCCKAFLEHPGLVLHRRITVYPFMARSRLLQPRLHDAACLLFVGSQCISTLSQPP